VNGYAASARVIRVKPRLIERGRWTDGAPARVAVEPAVVEDVDVVLAAGDGPAISLTERCDRFRERWAQLTFFLTDPNSWR
jgi:hypothetical protein